MSRRLTKTVQQGGRWHGGRAGAGCGRGSAATAAAQGGGPRLHPGITHGQPGVRNQCARAHHLRELRSWKPPDRQFSDLTADIDIVSPSTSHEVHVLHAQAHISSHTWCQAPSTMLPCLYPTSMCSRLQVVLLKCRRTCLVTLRAWPVMQWRTLPASMHQWTPSYWRGGMTVSTRNPDCCSWK